MRIRNTANQTELERVVDDYITQGYKVKSRGENTANLLKPEYGTAGMHVLFALVTWGVGNIIYAAVKYNGSDKVLVKVQAPTA